jgi:hypothetical protein
MLTYADVFYVCCRMLTYADACNRFLDIMKVFKSHAINTQKVNRALKASIKALSRLHAPSILRR